jgi:hypothetical protein
MQEQAPGCGQNEITAWVLPIEIKHHQVFSLACLPSLGIWQWSSYAAEYKLDESSYFCRRGKELLCLLT